LRVVKKKKEAQQAGQDQQRVARAEQVNASSSLLSDTQSL